MAGTLSVSHIQGLATHSDPTTVSVQSGHTLHAPGHIIQVVHANCSSHVTNTSATYISADVSVSITPKFSSSKILIISNLCLDIDASDNIGMKLKRDSTDIKEEAYWGYGTATDFIVSRNHHQYLDSPNSTSAITYSWDIKRISGSASFHVSYDDGSGETDSQITAMEISQ